MASPTFFPEGSTPASGDTRWRILQKILGATIDVGGGGGGGGGLGGWTLAAGAPAPGVTTGFYKDTDSGVKYANLGTVAVPDWDQI